jgi:hypothetical protein
LHRGELREQNRLRGNKLQEVQKSLQKFKRRAKGEKRKANALKEELNGIKHSSSYRLGRFLTAPLRLLRRIFR